MPDRDEVIERLQKVSHYFKSMLKVGYRQVKADGGRRS